MSAIVRVPIDLDAKRTEIQNEIDQIFIDFQQQEQHIDVQERRVSRNVLLVGPSKGGKTTLRRVLVDPRYVSEELSLRSLSDTVPTCELNIQPPSTSVTLNIVELPETMINASNNLSMINEECARLGIQDFHTICLCISVDTGIDGIAIRSFERFINHLGHEQLSQNLGLIITRCESKSDTQRQKLLSELMQDVAFADVRQYLGRGIHFSGALNRDYWNEAASQALYSQFETVYDYRRNLLQLIAKDIEPFHIRSPSSQPEARPSLLISGNDQTDSLQAVSQSSERSLLSSSIPPLRTPQVALSESHSTIQFRIPSQLRQLNQSLEQPTPETSLLRNGRRSKLSRFITRLRAKE